MISGATIVKTVKKLKKAVKIRLVSKTRSNSENVRKIYISVLERWYL